MNVGSIPKGFYSQVPQVFGPPPKEGPTSKLSQHGFARNSRWEYLGKSSTEDALDTSSVKLDFGLDRNGISEEHRKAWPLDFGLVYSVTLSKDTLQTVITVRNEGDESFEFQFLLHTYFKIKVCVNSAHVSRVTANTAFAGHLKGLSQRSRQCRVHRQGPQRIRPHTNRAEPQVQRRG